MPNRIELKNKFDWYCRIGQNRELTLAEANECLTTYYKLFPAIKEFNKAMKKKIKTPTLKQLLDRLVRESKSYGAYIELKGMYKPEERHQDWWHQKRIIKTKKEIRQIYFHLSELSH